MLAQVNNRENVGNRNGNVVNENVQENVGNVLVNGNRVVLTRWIEKMENVQYMSACSNDQKVKYTAGSFVGKALTWWNSQIRTLSQEVSVSMSWNAFKFMMIQEFYPSQEMQKLESELWNHAMVGAGHAEYTNRFHKLARLVPHLLTSEITEPKTMQKAVNISGALTDEALRNGSIKKVEKRINVGETSKDKNGRDDNKRTRTGNDFATTVNPAKDCRGVPRNVNPVNARNPTVRACYECGSTDHVRVVETRTRLGEGIIHIGARKLAKKPNIVTGIEPSELSFRYEMEIANGQLAEIDWVVRYHYRWQGLRVEAGRPEEKARLLMSAKASDRNKKRLLWLEIFLRSCRDNSRNSKTKVSSDQVSRLRERRTLGIKSPLELRKRRIDASFLSVHSWLRESAVFWAWINGNGIPVDPKLLIGCEEQELAFQTLKDKLCNASVLALLDGPEDFVVYWTRLCVNAKRCVCVALRSGDLYCMRQRVSSIWTIRFFSISLVRKILSRKERVKPMRVRAMNMILQSSIKDRILAAQKEAVDEFAVL
ncbi:reverse transcriptase domain-containing protein [Tanacetum coccineum]